MTQADIQESLTRLWQAKARLPLKCGRCGRVLDELVAGGMPPTVLSTTTFNPPFDVAADGTITTQPSRPKITKARVAGHWFDQTEYRCAPACGARYLTNNRDLLRTFVTAATAKHAELVLQRDDRSDQPAHIESRPRNPTRTSRPPRKPK